VNDTPRPGPIHLDGNFFTRLWRSGSERTVVVQRHGVRYLSVPLNVGVVILALLLIGTAPMWPLVAAAVIVALIAKVEIVVFKESPPS
jgi:hypothetical protein